MAEDRLRLWETLFKRALALIDSVGNSGCSFEPWTFGGGTVLMRKYRHRFSKDIDIFVPDPQYLGYVTPRLNETAEAMTGDYIEQGNFVKLLFPEGEIDFIASAPLTSNPAAIENLFEREVRVETTTEIIAKKLWHRGTDFKARDMFDLAFVGENEPGALKEIEQARRRWFKPSKHGIDTVFGLPGVQLDQGVRGPVPRAHCPPGAAQPARAGRGVHGLRLRRIDRAAP